jgi:SAM-dependent methyltransferase
MKNLQEDVIELIESVIQDYETHPVDLLGLDDAIGEFNYISNLKQHYVRTVHEISDLFNQKDLTQIKILEIGSYLGVVSIALSKLGFKIFAADLDIYMQNKNLQNKYELNRISFKSIDLKNPIPFPETSFDCVIMCETLEHLNFNPIPVLQEINRILIPGGYIYLTLPNLASLENRLKLLTGKSIHNSIDDYFTQLNPNSNFSVGLHWREYTKTELIYMLSKIGFEDFRHSFFHPWDLLNLPLKFYLKCLWRSRNLNYSIKKLFPSLKSNQKLVCSKKI